MAEYIEREALMKNFCGYDLTKCMKYGNKDADQQHDSYSTMMMYEIADEILDAPAADVAPVVRGMWELYPSSMHRRCSVCKMEYGRPKFNVRANYCPNCGAKMDLEVMHND